MSNILTKTADSFAHEFDNIVNAGLSSTPYQQTDDTSARVAGEFWHTHILCNPFYVEYFTRPQKDRLTVLEILQNTSELRFRFGEETLSLLQAEFEIPKIWQQVLKDLGAVECGKTALALILQGWFGNGKLIGKMIFTLCRKDRITRGVVSQGKLGTTQVIKKANSPHGSYWPSWQRE